MVGGAVFLESDTATTVLGPKVQEKWGQAAAHQQSLSWQELGAHGGSWASAAQRRGGRWGSDCIFHRPARSGEVQHRHDIESKHRTMSSR